MNPVFILLVLLIGLSLWLFCSSMFKEIGYWIIKIIKNTKDALKPDLFDETEEKRNE